MRIEKYICDMCRIDGTETQAHFFYVDNAMDRIDVCRKHAETAKECRFTVRELPGLTVWPDASVCNDDAKPVPNVCPECEGHGGWNDGDDDFGDHWRECPKCAGAGTSD